MNKIGLAGVCQPGWSTGHWSSVLFVPQVLFSYAYWSFFSFPSLFSSVLSVSLAFPFCPLSSTGSSFFSSTLSLSTAILSSWVLVPSVVLFSSSEASLFLLSIDWSSSDFLIEARSSLIWPSSSLPSMSVLVPKVPSASWPLESFWSVLPFEIESLSVGLVFFSQILMLSVLLPVEC